MTPMAPTDTGASGSSWGVQGGLELVRALMRDLGLVACQPRPWRPQTTQQGAAGPVPDLVNRDFSAGVPGAKMVGDITYVRTWEGWVYLAAVIDCATRKVAGWAHLQVGVLDSPRTAWKIRPRSRRTCSSW